MLGQWCHLCCSWPASKHQGMLRIGQELYTVHESTVCCCKHRVEGIVTRASHMTPPSSAGRFLDLHPLPWAAG